VPGRVVGAVAVERLYRLVCESLPAGVIAMQIFSLLRCASFLGVLLLGASGFTATASVLADGRTLAFDLMRKGKKVGIHTIRFEQKADLLTVDIAIDIKGKIVIIPFSYTHSNREVWRGGVLQSLESKTLINKTPHSLSVRGNLGGYDVIYDDKSSRIEGDIKTTSYWHPTTATQARLLNSQNGKVIPITFSAPITIQAPLESGGTLAAREIRMTDKKKFNANVAYDANNCLVGLNFKPPFDSNLIVYHLVSRPTVKAAPELLANPLLVKCIMADRR
jgi:Family of unknown function (DUF6134)